MSTILKALRRLEAEKQGEASRRDLREAVVAPSAEDTRRSLPSGRTLWLGAAALGVFCLGGGTALVLGLGRSADVEVAAPPQLEDASRVSPPAAAPAPGSRVGPATRRRQLRLAQADPTPGRALPPESSPPDAPQRARAADPSPGTVQGSAPSEAVAPAQPDAPRARQAVPAAPWDDVPLGTPVARPEPVVPPPTRSLDRPARGTRSPAAAPRGADLPDPDPAPAGSEERTDATAARAAEPLDAAPAPNIGTAAVMIPAATPEAAAAPAPPPGAEPVPGAATEAEAAPVPEMRAPPTAPAEVVELHPEAEPAGAPLVTRTVWHPSAGRRHAVVEAPGASDPVEVGEGDSVGGWRVVEIAPAGVTFGRGTRRVEVPVGAAR